MSYCTVNGNLSSILAQSRMQKVCRNGLASHAEVLRASTGVPPPPVNSSRTRFLWGKRRLDT